MKLSKKVEFELNFRGKYCQYSAALMGTFLFLRVLYYLGIAGLDDCSGSVLWMELIFPVFLAVCYIALLRGVQLNRPLVYGILGTAVCVLIIIWLFTSGTSVRTVVGLVWYLLAAAVLLGTVCGFIYNRLFLLVAFAVPLVLRFFADKILYQIAQLQIVSLMIDLSVLCALASLACLAPALIGRRNRK